MSTCRISPQYRPKRVIILHTYSEGTFLWNSFPRWRLVIDALPGKMGRHTMKSRRPLLWLPWHIIILSFFLWHAQLYDGWQHDASHWQKICVSLYIIAWHSWTTMMMNDHWSVPVGPYYQWPNILAWVTPSSTAQQTPTMRSPACWWYSPEGTGQA